MRQANFRRTIHFGNLLAKAAGAFPGRAMVFDPPSSFDPALDGELTLTKVAARHEVQRSWLNHLGVGLGSRVVVLKANHIDISFIALAVSSLGGLPILISDRVGADAKLMLERACADTIVTDRLTLDRYRDAFTDACGLRQIVVCGTTPPAAALSDTRIMALEDVRRLPFRSAPVFEPGPETPVLCTHTSGTTGTPKLVLHNRRSYMNAISLELSGIPLLSWKASDRYFASLSYVHGRSISLLSACLMNGMCYWPSTAETALEAASALAKFEPTIVETHPNLYVRWERHLTSEDRHGLARTRLFVNNFDAAHIRTIRSFLGAPSRRLPLWLQVWGQTEVGAATAILHSAHTARWVAERIERNVDASRSVGWPLPGSAKVRTVNGGPAGGHLQVRTRGISMTYVGQEDLHASRRRGRWWTTGDEGTRGRFRDVRLLDREIDAVPGIRSCLALEELLLERFPQLAEVCVLTDGRGPVVVTSCYDGQRLDVGWPTELCGMSVPQRVVTLDWEAIPRTGSWKVRRRALSELLDASTTTREALT